jgi:hypothetical protein
MARERNSKKTTTPPRSGQRTTARGFSVARDDDEPAVEPPHSSRPTRRDLAPIVESVPDARGQYSVQSVRRIQTDVVSGTIDLGETPKRRRGASLSGADVRLVTANERELGVVIRGDHLTLRRTDALALAKLIEDAFGD